MVSSMLYLSRPAFWGSRRWSGRTEDASVLLVWRHRKYCVTFKDYVTGEKVVYDAWNRPLFVECKNSKLRYIYTAISKNVDTE